MAEGTDKRQSRTRTAPVMIETAQRRAFVMNLRLSGATYQQIAEAAIRQFGAEHLPKNYNAPQAGQDVIRELQKLDVERETGRAELVRLELERLDRMLLAIWQQVVSGHLGAVDRGLRISERRAKMLGLDAPTKVAPTTPDGEKPAIDMTELVKLLQQADKLLEGSAALNRDG